MVSTERSSKPAGFWYEKWRTITIAGVAVALVAGCGGDSASTSSSPATPSPSLASSPSSSPSGGTSVPASTSEQLAKEPVPDRFETVEQLRDALIAGGYDCPAWQRDDRVKLALQSGQCSTQDVLMIFTGESAVQEAVQNFKGMGTTVVVGQNWIVNPHTPIAVTHAIGGTIVRAEVAPATAGASLSLTPEQRVFLSNVRAVYEAWTDAGSSDELILLTAEVACTHLGLNEFDDTVEFMAGNMPGGATVEQARDFTILSVMAFCNEHDPKLPG